EDPRLGGLYNNMGLALAATGRFGEAEALFRLALKQMEGTRYGPWEQAVTWLNLADTFTAQRGYEEAEEDVRLCLEQAEALLNRTEPVWDGYYAFVCEKCAPGFDHHGWFAFARELEERSEKLYAGS
ncbi:MAG: tetratricopeptide repeat protein, partial [Oscillospiraceae bacterium]|nr:tetratricopeptide repeat protein [Oscillospiraceae bacterium]